jgi:EpsI family protein
MAGPEFERVGMSKRARFWLMIAVLAGASIGLHHLSHGEAVPLSRPLSTLPVHLEDWQGADLAIEPRIVQALGVNDYLNRVYQAPDSHLVFLYVGYYKSQRTGVSLHSPKNCLPGAGWEPVSAGYRALTGAGGRRVLVNQYVVENGLRRQLVLYWYQSHGRVVASEYRGKMYMVLDALRLNRTDAALVRVSTGILDGNEQASLDRSIAFAEQFLVRSQGLLPD